MEKKFDCYKCKHKGSVPGSCHSSCNHPSLGETSDGEKLMSILAAGMKSPMPTKNCKDLNIKGSDYGKSQGWFNFPYNFDPTWLENCDGFELSDANCEGGENGN